MKNVTTLTLIALISSAMSLTAQEAVAKTEIKSTGNPKAPALENENIKKHPVNAATIQFIPGKGLEIKSIDERFRLVTRLRAQLLYSYDLGNTPGSNKTAFQVRRARLQFIGNFWGKHNKFKTEIAISPRDLGRDDFTYVSKASLDTTTNPHSLSTSSKTATSVNQNPLLDWYFTFDYFRDATLRVGQYKVPYSRQRVISSGNLQMVDRSTTANAEFTLDRDLGFDIRSKNLLGLNFLKYYIGAYIGEGRNTSNKTQNAGDLGGMYLARLEFLPLGKFKSDYKEADFSRSSKPRLAFGAAYAYLDHAPGDKGILKKKKVYNTSDSVDSQNATADMIFKIAGFSLQTEWFWRNFIGFGATARNGVGMMVQAGYLLPSTSVEVAARFGAARKDGTLSKSDLPESNETGVALSYYIAQHHFKIQADVFRYYEPALWSNGETQIRVQMQAAF